LQKDIFMKILVCISNVPDTTTKITFTNDNSQFNTAGVQFIVNPYDEIALSKAIALCEGGKGTVTVINVGDVSTDPTIRKALAIGADDAVRVNAAPRDAYFVAYQIAEYAKTGGFDMILCGRESIDYNGAQVPAMIAEFLDLPSVLIVKKLEFDGTTATLEREIEGGKEIVSVTGPFVASCAEGVAEPKIPNMRGIMSARSKPLQVVEATEIEALSSIRVFESPAPRGTVKLIASDQAENLIDLLHQEAKVI
jgi:electron transfer flavoprotein beta subunit